jgi:hypothetical protein
MITASECLESVVIDVSGNAGKEVPRKINGIIERLTNKRLTLVSGEALPVSANVTVQGKDLLFLGEVLSCVPESGVKWTTHVRVKRSLMIS